MSKGKKDWTPQLGLFETPDADEPTPGSLNCEYEIRAEMVRAIKRCKLSRDEIAEQMTDLVGREITKEMIDAWTAGSKKLHRPPAEVLPAFCYVTGSDGPIRAQVRKLDCEMSDRETTILAELGKAYLEEEEARGRKQELMRRIRR